MNSTEYKSGKKSQFIGKLLKMLDDENNAEAIKFDRRCQQLIVQSKNKLEQILPLFFNHSNFQTFTRQLNWFGFQKVRGGCHHIFRHPELGEGKNIEELKSKRKCSKVIKEESYKQGEVPNKKEDEGLQKWEEVQVVGYNNSFFEYSQPFYIVYQKIQPCPIFYHLPQQFHHN